MQILLTTDQFTCKKKEEEEDGRDAADVTEERAKECYCICCPSVFTAFTVYYLLVSLLYLQNFTVFTVKYLLVLLLYLLNFSVFTEFPVQYLLFLLLYLLNFTVFTVLYLLFTAGCSG